MSWTWYFRHMYENRAILRSPQAYAEYVRKCGAELHVPYFLQNSARAGAYPEGPDGGWRYRFQRLPVHGKLLKAYGLGEIAGQGDAFARALRVMDWLTAHTWYNGMSFWSGWLFQPINRGKLVDSLQVLRFACGKPFAHSINCGHKAIVLADCLLAVGIRAMPVSMQNYTYRADEEKVTPCPYHAVVHAWLPEESRWVMLDPSFNSYIADETGRALNLIEIQQRHRHGASLAVAQYSFNGTQDCRAEYLEGFVLGGLLEIAAWDGTDRKGGLRARLLPEDVPPQDEKMRAITVAELLAEPYGQEAAAH